MPFEWTHPEFKFRSHRPWTQLPTDDEFRIQLFCPETGTTVTLSSYPYEVPKEKMEKMAAFILDSRKNAYLGGLKIAFPNEKNPEVVYESEAVRPNAEGTAYEILYEGLHRGKSFFGFLGYVTSRKVVNIFVETKLSYARGHRTMFHEVVHGFEITLP